MPNYQKYGKVEVPLTEKQFTEGMSSKHFVKEKHKGFAALLYYSGVRKWEALRAIKKHFQLINETIFFEVGERLKHSRQTQRLRIPISKPFAEYIWRSVEETKKPDDRVWPYSDSTGYRIISRVWYYPHHLRLSRITDILTKKNVVAAKAWTGLTLQSLEYYVGLLEMKEIAEIL